MGLFDKLFGKIKKTSNRNLSPEAEEAFQKIYTFMTDESLQNQGYPQEFKQLMIAGGEVDILTGSSGDFGRDMGNPIPVNGPIGEIVYISNMALPTGIQVMGHRLVAVNCIDVYETVTLDGSRWDLIYFDPYHTRKSRQLPSGYQTLETPGRFLLATNFTVQEFPSGMDVAIQNCTEQLLGMPLVFPQLRDKSLFQSISRPPEHIRKLQTLALHSQSMKLDGDMA